MKYLQVLAILLASLLPVTAQVYPNLESKAFNVCAVGDCGGGSPGGTTSPTKIVNQVVMSGPFEGAHEVGLSGPPYTDLLTYVYVGATSADHFTLNLDQYVSPSTVSNSQAFEFDVFDYANPYKYQIGSECVVGAYWQVWNRLWQDTTRKCDLHAGWNHIEWYAHIANGQIYYDTLGVNYVYTNFDLEYPADALPEGWSNNSGVDVQIDESASGKTINEYVRHIVLVEF